MSTSYRLHPWLHSGNRSSDTLPAIAEWINRATTHVSANPAAWLLLDIGCGNGELLRLMHEKHDWPRAILHGVDIEPGHARVARERTGLSTIWHQDVAEMKPCVRFGVVTAINCLHNDWSAVHAVECEHRRTARRLDRIAEVVRGLLSLFGYFLFDWRGSQDGHAEFGLSLQRYGLVQSGSVGCKPECYVWTHAK